MDYTTIKELAKETNARVTDLIALAPKNDPFYTGTPSDWTLGSWFAALWRRFGYSQGVHIRRVHYQIISQTPPVTLPDGTPYENTEACWDILNQAAKNARYLGLVEPGAFVDRRNPDPRIFTQWRTEDPALWVTDPSWGGMEMPDFPDLPGYRIEDYTGDQGYHLEIWCEKSTMNDVLIPLCERYQINLVTGVGEMSITAVLQLAERFQEGRPVRIFYVSDFDPAGQSMPVAVARKIEYFQRDKGYAADVRLYPVVLTIDQVRSYRLPRTPIKESERRAAHFEDRYGAGAVELDALEALYPGRLATILTGEIERYYDRTLGARVQEAQEALEQALHDERQAVIDAHAAEIDELRSEYAELRNDFDARVASLAGRVRTLWAALADELDGRAPDIHDYPIPQAEDADERPDPLYDSEREYLEQIDAYKAFQGK